MLLLGLMTMCKHVLHIVVEVLFELLAPTRRVLVNERASVPEIEVPTSDLLETHVTPAGHIVHSRDGKEAYGKRLATRSDST